MAQHREQRRTTRAKIAGRLAGQTRATLECYLLDLSATGARIEHFGFLQPGTTCTFEFPPELGSLTLSARVVRSTVVGMEQGSGREELLQYETGLEFIHLTAEQQAALSRILE